MEKKSDPQGKGGDFDRADWALILGGSSGLGLATAKKLALHGMNICVVHRNPRSEMRQISQEFKEIEASGVSFLSFNKDAVREDHRDQIVEDMRTRMGQHARIRLLVHSIARGNLKPMSGQGEKVLSHSDLVMTLEAMALSLYDWSRRLLQEGWFVSNSRIIGFTSEGNTRVMNNYGAVSMAKSALESICRQLAVELGPSGVSVNCIQAGVTDTRSLQMIPGSEKLKEIALRRNPKGRLTRPEDVANVVYLLCREEADWINGTTLVVDGGEHLR